MRAAGSGSRSRSYRPLQAFIADLERRGLLRRVRAEVDPILEAGEIAQRVLREAGPALLFENPKGASFPLLMNLFGTSERVRLALGREPGEVAVELLTALEKVNPPTLAGLWSARETIRRGLAARPRRARRAPCQEIIEPPDLTRLPILKCWPGDAGRFITWGIVITRHPETGRRNCGLYRMQVFDSSSTGMHWQSMKGGRGHYWAAEQRGEPLDVAVVVGCDPALMLSAVLPLPEDVDEILFAGFLRGQGVGLTPASSVRLDVPADAELVLEGQVPPNVRRIEGPFGDHFGHYSDASGFPVFRIGAVTRRRDAVYVGTIVGKPPQEDKFIGMAAGEMVGPLIRIINPNIRDMCAYAGAGFHNLLVVSLAERHPKEVLRTAMSLLGTGQLSLTKVLVCVRPEQDPSDFSGVLGEIGQRFDPAEHMLLLPTAPLDTLDFTSFTMHVGSKLVIDATGETLADRPGRLREDPDRIDARVLLWKQLAGGFLVVRAADAARQVLEKLVGANLGPRFIIAVSPDVDLEDAENLQWGIFTRFDPVRDMVFSRQEFRGARPVYEGCVGIDATWKPGYPEPLEMDPAIVRRVDARWNDYWR